MPSILEIGVEEDVYSLILRWELRPSLRKARVDGCETISRKSGEVRGDKFSHAGSRVEEDSDFEQPEALYLSAEGMGVQERGLGREVTADRAQGSATMGSLKRACGPCLQSPSMGLKLKRVVAEVAGPKAGPSKRWAIDEAGPMPDGPTNLDGARPDKPTTQGTVKGPQEKACLLECIIAISGRFSEAKQLVSWETEGLRKQKAKVILSATDKALVEEAMRYGFVLKTREKMVYGSPHLISYSFDRAPEGEYYDRSGVLGEVTGINDENIDNHGYIGTSILQIYRIYRRYIGGYFGKKYKRIFWKKISINLKLIKIYKNIRKTS